MSQTSVGKNFWAGLASGIKDKELQKFLLTGNKRVVEKKQDRTDGKGKKKKPKIIEE